MSELDLTAPKCLIAFRLLVLPQSICPFNKIRQITNGQNMTRINSEKIPGVSTGEFQPNLSQEIYVLRVSFSQKYLKVESPIVEIRESPGGGNLSKTSIC